MSDYDADILLWSERQAKLLRRLAAGERVKNLVDWNNVIDEVESVGNEQRFAVEALLINIMRHRLQIAAWPEASVVVAHWRHEIDVWRVQVERRLRRAPALRPVIEAELGDLCRDAVRTMYREVDSAPPLPVPPACPFTLDELLAEPPEA